MQSYLVMTGYIALILIIPGPTNTLLLSAGARKGLSKTIPLVFAEALGYLLAITLWGCFLLSVGKILPSIYQWARMICATYILWLSFKIWRLSFNTDESKENKTDFINVFIATLLNPKAILFASSILPGSTFLSVEQYTYTMVVFLIILFPIGILWVSFGGWMKMSSRIGNSTGWILRIASCFLLFFSFMLAYSGIAKAE